VVANPLSEDEPLLRTTLLPGLLRVLARNIGRGFADTALFEIGLVFRPRPGAAPAAPILAVDRGPTVAELASLEAALPDQPQRIAAVLAGARELDGWWGPGRASSWADAIEAARAVGRICRVPLDIRADKYAPWHPGRCAAIYARVGSEDTAGQPRDGGAPNGQTREWLAGHAGELHPRVIQAFGLPDRTCAMELDLSVLFAAAETVGAVQAPQLSAYPLRFRAPDGTLTAAETTQARDAAVAEAQRRVGAVLRSG
jgi:phenylalanyl-tRNA synthetase beta chain